MAALPTFTVTCPTCGDDVEVTMEDGGPGKETDGVLVVPIRTRYCHVCLVAGGVMASGD